MCSLSMSLLLSPGAGVGAAQLPVADAPSYVQRGEDVQATYAAFVDRLQRFYARLRRAVEREAPELALRLDAKPPTPVAYGYQRLPTLVPGRAESQASRPKSISFSWPRTQRIIDGEVARLAAAEGVLDAVASSAGLTQRAPLERLIGDYELLERNQRTAEQHLGHNRFWQREVAENPDRFERLTDLHNAVVERERLFAEAAADLASAEARSAATVRAETLRAVIQRGRPQPALPGYARMIARVPGDHVVHVPLYTDITNQEFLDAAERATEDVWRIQTAAFRLSVDIEIRLLAPEMLYEGAVVLTRGSPIDIKAHVARFPDDGGVLTTGVNRTHASVGRYVALGPGQISGNSLAHEFGHILGFSDGYFRGARDLGDAGYEILEISSDPEDIMAAPGNGAVLAAHAEQLLAAAAAR